MPFFVSMTLFALPVANAIEVLALEERDIDNDSHTISEQPGIIDINSLVTIKIDKVKLRNEMMRMYNQFPADDIRTIRVLQNSIDQGLDNLDGLVKALDEWSKKETHTREDVEKFSKTIAEVADNAVPVLRFAVTNKELDERINNALEELLDQQDPEFTSSADQYRTALTVADEYVNKLNQELDAKLREQGVYVQMGAWLMSNNANTPIHLSGFDTYPMGEFHEVDRWNLVALTSEENRQLFKEAQKTAKEINEKQKQITDVYAEFIPDTFKEAIIAIDTCANDLEIKVKNLSDSVDPGLRDAKVVIGQVKNQVDAYTRSVKTIKQKYNGLDVSGVESIKVAAKSLKDDFQTLRGDTANLVQSIGDLVDQLIAIKSRFGAELRQQVEQLKENFKECQSVVKEQIEIIHTTVAVLANMVHGREVVTGSLNYTEKVLKHDIDSLPQDTSFDLRNTGRREHGDSVVIRISSGVPEQAVRHHQERHIRMYKVLTYVDVAVSLIFAEPKDETLLDSRFQAAPSYSVLLKKGSRSSTFRNELLQPAIGLNFAALDFNRDETLEFGVGVTLSVFRDYIQAGYGYNINEDEEYWFFGLKFPIPESSGAKAALP
jgi:uncharacterized coiled-coil DUF342 family protein